MNDAHRATWLSQIEAARSVRDLVGILRDYLSSMTPDQAAELPRGCTAENISIASEIQEWAVALAREDLKGAGEGVLHQAAGVFSAAGAKLPKLAE